MASNAEKALAIISTLNQYGVVLAQAKQNALYKTVLYKLNSNVSGDALANYVLGRAVVKNAFNSAYSDMKDVISSVKADLVKSISTASTTGIDPNAPAAPVYAASVDKTTVDEGGVVTFTLSATNVPAGTVLPYVLTGVNSADVAGGSLTGSVVIGVDGKATVPVLLSTDLTTEGAETLGISFAGKTASVSVNDTSVAPTPTTMTASTSSMTEGATGVTYSVTGEAGKTVFWSIDSAHSADVDKNAGAVTLDASGKGSFAIAAVKDGLSEGNEVAVVTLTDSNAKAVASTSTLIVDDLADSKVIALSDGGVKTTTEGQTGITYTVSGGTAGTQYIWAVDQADQVTQAGDRITLDANGSATFTISAKQDNKQEAPTAVKVTVSNLNTGAVVANSGFVIFDDPNVSQSFILTTGVDMPPLFLGGAGNDTFNGLIDTATAANTTFGALDSLDGGAGTDVLNLNVVGTAAPLASLPAVTVANIETANIRSAVAFTGDVSSWTGLKTVNVAQGTNVTLTGASTTVLDVKGTTGSVALEGGSSQTVNTAGTTVDLGGTTPTTGVISVTHTKQAGNDIVVNGGADVSVSSAGSTGGDIWIGDTNKNFATLDGKSPTGAVAVSSAYTAVVGTATTLADINVRGGSKISATQTATSTLAATDKTGSTVTQGDVNIIGGTSTTEVSVSQAKSTTQVVAVDAVAGSTETSSVKFGVLKNGDAVTLDLDNSGTVTAGDLRFTAGKDMTAAEVAKAFANLVKGGTQAGGAVSYGKYDQNGSANGWTSAAANGDTVVFTSTTAKSNVTDLAVLLTNTSGTSGAITVTPTNGVASVVAKTGVLGVVTGNVTIDDNATAPSITSVSIDSYDNSAIGGTNALTKLANLSIANSGGAAAGATNATLSVYATGVTALNMGINAIKGNVSLDKGGASVKTLNLAATGASSNFALTAAAVETLAVTGTTSATLTAALGALKTVTVGGSSGLTLNAGEAATLTSVDTSGTTGSVTATIDGAKAIYTGGAGVDSVTLATTTALTKAINLGAGDDTLNFAALSVTGSSAALNGGDGTDTLAMQVAAADALDGSAQSFYTGFERLTLSNAYGSDNNVSNPLTLNLANLGFTNFVTTAGTVADTTTVANSDVLTLDKLASNGTVVLTANGLVNVNVTDAATGTADVVNAIVTTKTASLNAGTLTVPNVETVNLASTDAQLDNNLDGINEPVETNTLILTANSATKVAITGNANTNLTLTGSTKVTAIDGSTLTGNLVVTSVNTTAATTITGGSGNDDLMAAAGTTADVLLGGAGNDTLTANKGLDMLTGGDGADTFVINTASLNSSSYATVTDFKAGDFLKFVGANSFAASKVVQADTAVFQDYVNAAMNASATGDVSWFVFNGNTYVVMDEATTNSTTFLNGEDYIVKLAGVIDLTNATFNNTTDTIAIF